MVRGCPDEDLGHSVLKREFVLPALLKEKFTSLTCEAMASLIFGALSDCECGGQVGNNLCAQFLLPEPHRNAHWKIFLTICLQ